MSANRLVLWDDFVDNLEADAKIGDGKALRWNNDVRAQAACNTIRNSRGHACFLDAIRRALTPKVPAPEMPLQTERLAAICWPLVVSTNYDDLYFGACLKAGGHVPIFDSDIRILGRSPKDCKTVLSSFHGPFDRRYIWHIQGFLGGQYGGGIEMQIPRLQELQEQLVIGHAEYSAVTNASPHFRRCFGQMFESRSFLFLGSSLTEAYFMNLFGEVLELCGPNHIPHFALAKAGTVDIHFLAQQMNITVCEFSDFADLPDMLEHLARAIAKPPARATSWSFMVESTCQEKADLQIVCEDAPSKPPPGEIIAFVARRDPKTNLPVLPSQYAWLRPREQLVRHIGQHTVQYGETGVYAVTARCRGDEDDSAVDTAVREFLEHITPPKSQHQASRLVHLQLSPGRGTVPPVFGFMKVVRAFGRWVRLRQTKATRLTLIVHVQNEVEFNLTSGRIDVQELLTSDWIRFWAVISSGEEKEPARRVLTCKENTTVKEVLAEIGVPFGGQSAEWSLSICPAPRPHSAETRKTTWTLTESDSLLSVGVLFGSVVTFDCVAAKCLASAAAAGDSTVLLGPSSPTILS